MAARPTAAELEAARDKPILDVIAPDLEILFVGINPGLYSGATGHHFARPGNRFWRAIHDAGLTPSLLSLTARQSCWPTASASPTWSTELLPRPTN